MIRIGNKVFERKFRQENPRKQKFSDKQYLIAWNNGMSDYAIAGVFGVKRKACWSRRLAFDLPANRRFWLDSKGRKQAVELMKKEHRQWSYRNSD